MTIDAKQKKKAFLNDPGDETEATFISYLEGLETKLYASKQGHKSYL